MPIGWNRPVGNVVGNSSVGNHFTPLGDRNWPGDEGAARLEEIGLDFFGMGSRLQNALFVHL
jgi:hypothetical protein